MALITLTTDFGTRDSYVAQLKGVLFSDGPPGLTVVDLSHELTPFDVRGAALFVRAAFTRFPRGSVHLAVVDPGVGSERRALIVERDDMLLVGPDNGLFSYLFDGRVYTIERAARPLSSTFHGRDLFAPIAARLATGAAASSFGPRIDDYQRFALPTLTRARDGVSGHVIHVDHYGNLITNITRDDLPPGPLTIELATRKLDGLRDHYAEAARGQLLALIGSSGQLEIAAREAHAAAMIGATVGDPVRVMRSLES